MTDHLRRVCVTGTGSFLPNDPVPGDRIDDVLGRLDEAPQRVQTFMKNVGGRMLEGCGINHRHFAVDPQTHVLTHTITSLSVPAAQAALEAAGRKPEEIDLLIISSPIHDRGTPPTSALLQAALGIERCAEMEIHSNCSGIGKAVQVAYDALRVGRFKTALVVYTQHSSTYLRGCMFNQPKMTKTQAALRYILADGSGALVLESRGQVGGDTLPGEILGTYIESIGGKLDPAMTCGGGVEDCVQAKSPAESVIAEGLHHLDQDFSAVSRFAGERLYEGMMRMLETLDASPHDLDHFVWSIPTLQLYKSSAIPLIERMSIPPERLKFRTAECGYCGGATLLIHLDEMIRSGELERGQRAVVYSVESSKWMSGGFLIRW